MSIRNLHCHRLITPGIYALVSGLTKVKLQELMEGGLDRRIEGVNLVLLPRNSPHLCPKFCSDHESPLELNRVQLANLIIIVRTTVQCL